MKFLCHFLFSRVLITNIKCNNSYVSKKKVSADGLTLQSIVWFFYRYHCACSSSSSTKNIKHQSISSSSNWIMDVNGLDILIKSCWYIYFVGITHLVTYFLIISVLFIILQFLEFPLRLSYLFINLVYYNQTVSYFLMDIKSGSLPNFASSRKRRETIMGWKR